VDAVAAVVVVVVDVVGADVEVDLEEGFFFGILHHTLNI
jgi:hypothetical protein